ELRHDPRTQRLGLTAVGFTLSRDGEPLIAPALGGLLLGRDTLIGHRRHRRRLVLDRRGRGHWSRSGGFCDRHRGRLLAFAAACCPCPADGAAASPSSRAAWTSRGA